MKRSLQKSKLIGISLLGLVLMFSFNNCAQHSTGFQEVSQIQGASCDQFLKTDFDNNYYPYLTRSNSCQTCHNEAGISPYKFAADDSMAAFQAFQKLGHAKLYKNAIDPVHAKGVTGPAQQVPFDTLGVFWKRTQSLYDSCMAGNEIQDQSFETMGKVADAAYFSNTKFQLLNWSLNNPKDLVPGSPQLNIDLQLEVKLNYPTGATRPSGYLFNKLQVRAQNGIDQVSVDGIYIFINGKLIPELTDYAQVSATITGIEFKTWAESKTGTGFVVNLPQVSNKDMISIYFRSFNQINRADKPPLPPAATLTQTPTFMNPVNSKAGTVSFSVDPKVKVSQYCLTTSATAPSSSRADCVGRVGLANTQAGWFVCNPAPCATSSFSISDFNLSMAGVPVDGTSYSFYVYIADTNLMISPPAKFTVKYDATAPATPKILNVTYQADPLNQDRIDGATGTQIVTLSVTDVVDASPLVWCVMDSDVPPPDQAISANNPCFKEVDYRFVNTSQNGAAVDRIVKPSVYGLTGSFKRYISVFVKDQAGNVSKNTRAGAADVLRPVVSSKSSFQDTNTWMVDNSTLQTLRLTQLQDATKPTGVLGKKCATCHNTTNVSVVKINFWETGVNLGVSGIQKKSADGSLFVLPEHLRTQGAHQGVYPLSDTEKRLLNLWFVNKVQ